MCDVTHYMTEIKCPFMGENHGKPMDYKNVCINHISQIMLEMLCSSTQECHYVVWKRGDSYIELLLKYRPLQIWNLALDKVQPAWHEDVFGLYLKK